MRKGMHHFHMEAVMMLWLAAVLVILVPLSAVLFARLGQTGRLVGMLILLAGCCLLIVIVLSLVSTLRNRGTGGDKPATGPRRSPAYGESDDAC